MIWRQYGADRRPAVFDRVRLLNLRDTEGTVKSIDSSGDPIVRWDGATGTSPHFALTLEVLTSGR